jgi:pilus assembly protein CpaB
MVAMSIPTDRISLSGYAINSGAHVNLNACFLFVDVDPTFQTMLPNLTAALTGTGFMPESTIPILSLGVAASGSQQGRLELDPSLQQPYYLLPSETSQRPRMVCQMILQNVLVMKTGDFSLEPGAQLDTPSVPAAPPAEGETAAQTTVPAPDIVTLVVTPQDSITLTYLINLDKQAKLSMTLRRPGDDTRQALEAATLQFLLSQYNIPVPAKLPYALQPALSGLLPSVEPAIEPAQ